RRGSRPARARAWAACARPERDPHLFELRRLQSGHHPPAIRRTHMITTVDDATFDADVLASDTPVLVEFGAAWCPPCRMLAPVLEEVANERSSELRVITVDVDASPVTQGRYGVMSVPTLLVFIAGRPVRQMVGFTSKGRVLAFIEDALQVAA